MAHRTVRHESRQLTNKYGIRTTYIADKKLEESFSWLQMQNVSDSMLSTHLISDRDNYDHHVQK